MGQRCCKPAETDHDIVSEDVSSRNEPETIVKLPSLPDVSTQMSNGSLASNNLAQIKQISDAELQQQENLKSLGIEAVTISQDSTKGEISVCADSTPKGADTPKATDETPKSMMQNPGSPKTVVSHKPTPPEKTPGHGLFWVFVTCMHEGKQKVLGLRNYVLMDPERGLHYLKLSRTKGGGFSRTEVKVKQGEAFGQWCRIGDSTEQRLLRDFKNTAPVKGKQVKEGLQPTQEIERNLPQVSEVPIPDEFTEVDYFEDTQDRLPLGLEQGFNIKLFELQGEPGKVGAALKKNYKQVSKLPFGLPWSVDEFRDSPMAGAKQASGFVDHINGQQFCVGSQCTFVWVRFDIGDLNSFDHDFTGVPVIKDGKKGLIFPVTHLWVDLIDVALEWFIGKRCIARKKMNLWFIPGAVLRGVVSFGMRRLTEGKFEEDEEKPKN